MIYTYNLANKIMYTFNAMILFIIKKDELKFYSFGNVFFPYKSVDDQLCDITI